MPRKKKATGRVLITYTRSAVGYSERQKGTIRALGLRRLGDAVEHQDTPVLRGMVEAVRHLVQVKGI